MSSTLFIPLLAKTLLIGLRKGSMNGTMRRLRRKTWWSIWTLNFTKLSPSQLRYQALMETVANFWRLARSEEGTKQRWWNSGKSKSQEKRPSTTRTSASETWKWSWLESLRLWIPKTRRLTRRSPSYSMSNALLTRMRTLETSWSRWWMLALLSSTRMVLWLYLL